MVRVEKDNKIDTNSNSDKFCRKLFQRRDGGSRLGLFCRADT